MDNILQVSMDDPRVNWKSYDILTKDREQSELSGLINIGSCGLHVLQGTFKISFEVVVLEIKKLLNWLFNLFHDSPARWSGLLIQKNFVAQDGWNSYWCLAQCCKNVWILGESSKMEALLVLKFWRCRECH